MEKEKKLHCIRTGRKNSQIISDDDDIILSYQTCPKRVKRKTGYLMTTKSPQPKLPTYK